MKTTDKETCQNLIEILVAHGVNDIVVSPGSRNTPLILAANRNDKTRTHVVIDERSAAFFGLGISLHTQKPVALICTSGSAVLNYAPALSEAYYRHAPLIAISADRPAEWIDQDDSQTIRQSGVVNNIVKGSFDLYGENCDKVHSRFAARTINDAITLAKREPQGPVHLNIRLDEPLGNLTEENSKTYSKIDIVSPAANTLSHDQYAALAKETADKRIMVIGGFGPGNPAIDNALDTFVKQSGAVLLHEAQSNLRPTISVGHIDACLATFTDLDREKLKPDLVITFGGSIVSRMIKQYLREAGNIEHWHIAESANSIDCFLALTHRIECNTADFFNGYGNALAEVRQADTSYLNEWLAKKAEARAKMLSFYKNCPWSDFYAMGKIINMSPRCWNLQLSNGTAIRYAQLFDYSAFSRIECNRGVSGIDGATSTAIGSHVYYDDVTLLVSGDMSAQYDSGALALTQITPRFKMAVLNNSGGGIFRFIKSTSHLDECEDFFAAKVNLPLRYLAEAYGFAYFEANDKASFDISFGLFAAEQDKPAIINIITPPLGSASTLKEFFKHQKNN